MDTKDIKNRVEEVIALMNSLKEDIDKYAHEQDSERIDMMSKAWKDGDDERYEQLKDQPYELHEIKVFAGQLKFGAENIKNHANTCIRAMRTLESK